MKSLLLLIGGVLTVQGKKYWPVKHQFSKEDKVYYQIMEFDARTEPKPYVGKKRMFWFLRHSMMPSNTYVNAISVNYSLNCKDLKATVTVAFCMDVSSLKSIARAFHHNTDFTQRSISPTGMAPETLAISCPSLNTTMVGMLRMPYGAAACG